MRLAAPARRFGLVIAAALGLTALASGPAAAQNPLAGDWTVTVGAEGRVVPEFLGSDDYKFSPFPLFSVRRAGTTAAYKAPDDGFGFAVFDTGRFRLGPVGRFNGGRDQDDSPALRGLGDVDFALEAGFFVEGWPADWLRLRGEFRRGFGGHHGFVADLGADLVARPYERLLLSIGPRVTLADEEYMQTFFGVTPFQSLGSGLGVYDPDGGIRSAGVLAAANYRLTERITLLGFARYDRLVGDAADAPLVTRNGSENQFSAGLGVTYSFDVSLFK